MKVKSIDDKSFKSEVEDSKVPVLVDFYADWCVPCRMLSPVMENLAEQYTGKIKVCKLNVDESNETASQFRVSSIPTVILFKDGKTVDQFMGAMPKQVIEDFIENNIS